MQQCNPKNVNSLSIDSMRTGLFLKSVMGKHRTRGPEALEGVVWRWKTNRHHNENLIISIYKQNKEAKL